MTASTPATDRGIDASAGIDGSAGADGSAGIDGPAGADRSDEGGDQPSRPRSGRHRRVGRRRWLAWTAAVLSALLLAVVVDGVVITHRIRHVDIALPVTRPGAGQNFLILGSDSRADLPAGASPGIGTPAEVPGDRADVVLVVHVAPDGSATTLSLPRDLVVSNAAGYPRRIALTLLDGPQAAVDAVCRSLGIATSHLVMIDFAGFAAVVDAAGGVPVDLPYPIRDREADLSILTSGRVRLDGLQALALIRSRHPSQLIGGAWVPLDDADGAAQRTRWAGLVFQTLQQAAARAKSNPVMLQRLAWNLSGAVTTDSGTGPFDLLDLASSAGPPVVVPAAALATDTLAQQATPDTFATLRSAGIDGGCTPRVPST